LWYIRSGILCESYNYNYKIAKGRTIADTVQRMVPRFPLPRFQSPRCEHLCELVGLKPSLKLVFKLSLIAAVVYRFGLKLYGTIRYDKIKEFNVDSKAEY